MRVSAGSYWAVNYLECVTLWLNPRRTSIHKGRPGLGELPTLEAMSERLERAERRRHTHPARSDRATHQNYVETVAQALNVVISMRCAWEKVLFSAANRPTPSEESLIARKRLFRVLPRAGQLRQLGHAPSKQL